MKIIYTLLIASLISIGAEAQYSQITPVFSLTFEDTAVINQVFYTDSTLDPQGIWQIGVPNKPLLDSAYSPPNAIATVLDSAMPPGTKASFIITLPGIQLNPSQGGLFTFVHRFQFDTAHGGGYVEFSVDTGRHWHGIYTTQRQSCLYGFQYVTIDGQYIDPPTWWDSIPKDTTSTGVSYFTGTDSTWIFDSIALPNVVFGEKTSQLTEYMFRFTAFTDSLSPALGGWLIDNITYSQFTIFCGGGINEINSPHLHVYPDPATDGFTVSLLNEPESDYELTLYDLSGRVVKREDFTGQEAVVERGGIDAGPYFIQVMDRRTQSTFQKRMVFE